jgi:hypothetical protein
MPNKGINIPERLKRIIEIQKRRLERLTVAEAKKLHKSVEQAIADLERRLRSFKREDIYTAQQHRIYLAQLYQIRDQLRLIIQAHITESQRKSEDQAKQDLVQKIKAINSDFQLAGSPISVEEVSRFLHEQSKIREIYRTRAETIAKKYSDSIIGQIEQRLAHGLLLGESVDSLINSVGELTKQEYWKNERLVRTEMSFAYNTSQRIALDEIASEDPNLWIQWHEHASGPAWGGPDNKSWPGEATPLDDRVGSDSLRMHGQLRRPGQFFIDPLTGKEYYSPPNRPNDRATLILVEIKSEEKNRK